MVDLAEFEFWDAVLTAGLGKDPAPLVRLLRSDYHLSTKEKNLLADLLDGKLKRSRGARPWRATDALKSPEKAAVRHAASLIEWIKMEERRRGISRKGRHERAVQQALDYMERKGLRLPDPNSLENFLLRSKRDQGTRSTKS
jgi:hypothetical protein